MKCPFCNTENDENAIFCRNCGNKISFDNSQQFDNDNQNNSSDFQHSFNNNTDSSSIWDWLRWIAIAFIIGGGLKFFS